MKIYDVKEKSTKFNINARRENIHLFSRMFTRILALSTNTVRTKFRIHRVLNFRGDAQLISATFHSNWGCKFIKENARSTTNPRITLTNSLVYRNLPSTIFFFFFVSNNWSLKVYKYFQLSCTCLW